MLWTCLRLGIETPQATSILDNHLSQLALWTSPQGRASLLELRQFVLRRLHEAAQEPSSPIEVKANSYF